MAEFQTLENPLQGGDNGWEVKRNHRCFQGWNSPLIRKFHSFGGQNPSWGGFRRTMIKIVPALDKPVPARFKNRPIILPSIILQKLSTNV